MRSPKSRTDARAMVTKGLVLAKAIVKQAITDDASLACDAGKVTPLGQRLDELARAFGWTWSRLSLECELTRTHVERIVKSGVVNSTTILAIHRRTNVDVAWLITGEGQLNRETLSWHPKPGGEASGIAARTKRKPSSRMSATVRASASKDDPGGSKRPRRT